MTSNYEKGYYDTLTKLGMFDGYMEKEAWRQQAAKFLSYLNPLKWFKRAPAGPTRGGGLGEALRASMQDPASRGGALGEAIQASLKTTGKTMPQAKPWTLGRKLKWGAGLTGAGLLGYHLLGDKPQTPEAPQQEYSDPYQQGYYY